MLQAYGMGLGWKMLLRGRLRQGMVQMMLPVNYWRTLEYREVVREANFQPRDQVLDIGSPKLLSLYLAQRIGAGVYATDIDDYFIPEYSLMRELAGVSPEKYQLKAEDGRKLSFGDESFDKVYSISVIEHIPAQGDSECAREIARVLKQGGRCYITVPFSPTGRVDYVEKPFYWSEFSETTDAGKIFFQRAYNEVDLYQRIIRPSGLVLKKLTYYGERVWTRSRKLVEDQLTTLSGPIQPLLSRLLLTSAPTWQELKKPMAALVVLEKA